MSKTWVISLGGSLIATRIGIDTNFLKQFRAFINKEIRQGHRFYLVVGGGVTARDYIEAALKTADLKAAERDWVGISATRLNAQLVRTIFGSVAHPELILDPTRSIKSAKKVVLAGGYKPGWSTDYVAVLLAKYNGIDTVINLSNIDFAYDKDPRKFPEAKKLINVSWPEFRQIVGNVWRPGINSPFDPVASRTAAQQGMKVIILNGKKLKNLGHFLAGQKFVGTTIS